MTLTDLSLQVRSLKKEKKYREALAVFKKEKVHFAPEQIASGGPIIADLMDCLRQTGQAHHAFTLLETYGIPLSGETHSNILSSCGWVLHSLLKQQQSDADESEVPDDERGSADDDDTFGEAVDTGRAQLNRRVETWLGIMRDDMEGFNYSVVSNVFKTFLRTESKRQNADWALVERVTSLLDPASLSTDCFRTKRLVKGVEKETELASDRESWYAGRTKALENLGRYDECEALCQEALGAFDKFHYGNEVWFARRIALARLNAGDIAAARKGLEDLLKKKNEWFIRKEIAELDYREGLNEKALAHCRQALAGHGDLEYKVGLLLLTARVLKAVGNKPMADRHYRMMQLVREQQGWRTQSSLSEEMQDMDPAVAAMQDIRVLMRELHAFWVEGQPVLPKGRLKGHVRKILHDNAQGVDGFIFTQAGEKYYFSLSAENPIAAEMKQDRPVSFEVALQKDGKPRAVKIRTG
jgi:tetratricopeptide (TPR) repeat protein